MSELHSTRLRSWAVAIAAAALLGGHGVFLYVLRHTRVPSVAVSGAVAAGVVLLVIAKHVGVFAALLRSAHAFFRRGSRG